MQRVLSDAEARIKEIQKDGKDVWSEVARDHGIDIVNSQWDFEEASGEIILRSVSFMPSQTAN